jgi:hypothetical protein
VDKEGLVTAEAVAAAMTDETVLVTVMHSNNEIGALLPVAAIAAACKAHGVVMHTDAAQSVGKVPVKVRVGGGFPLNLASAWRLGSLRYVTWWEPPTAAMAARVRWMTSAPIWSQSWATSLVRRRYVAVVTRSYGKSCCV